MLVVGRRMGVCERGGSRDLRVSEGWERTHVGGGR